MSQLPNIVEREKGLFATIIWVLSKSYQYQKKIFIAFLFFTLISSALTFLNIISFSKIVNILERGSVSFSALIPYLVLLLVVEYLPPVIGYIRSYFSSVLRREVGESVEEEMYRKVATIDIATIEQPEFGDLLMKAQRGVSSIESVRSFSFDIIRDIASFIIAAVILIKVLPLGFLIIFTTLIPTFVLEHSSSKKLFEIWEQQIIANRSINGKSSQFKGKLSLIEVKFFNIANFLLNKITKLRLGKGEVADKYSREKIPQFAGVSLLAELGSIVTIGWVIFQVIQGDASLASLTLIWGTISRFSGVTQNLFRSFGRLPEHQAHVLKLYSLLTMESYIDEHKGEIVADSNPPKIEFKNVSFAYPGTDTMILKNMSFVIYPKEEVALVGLNGAGKTTLLRLVTRVYDPIEGEILINDIPLRDYKLTSWRKNISIMNQDYTIFQEETIKDNIIFDNQEKSELLDRVIVESDVASYVDNYEKGIDQLIGKEFYGGTELSKGQNQKLSLARTLYRDTSLIVLDEPTAAVDAISEDMIFKSLREGHKDQTRIIISHKFSNVRDADKIILIEHGKIIEEGTHEQLMKKKKGKYKELFELQAEGYK